ncbi:hypothetical protein STEG23_022614 [Scotinomys teguina]
MPALSRKGDELFLRWLSDPETKPALQDWLWQIQSEITHLLVMLGSKVKRQEDFVVFQQTKTFIATPVHTLRVLGGLRLECSRWFASSGEFVDELGP